MSKWHAIVVTALAGMLAALAARGQAQTPAYEIVVSTGHRDDVTRVTLARGGTLLASSAGDQSKLWDVATGHLLRNIEGGLLAISADGQRMLAGSTGMRLRLSDPVTGEGRQALPAEAPWNVHALAFPPQGARAIAGDEVLELWDADAGKRLRRFEGHTARVGSAVLSADGTRLASASSDSTLRIWNTATGGSLRVINYDAEAVAISPKGDRIAAGPLTSGTAKLWDSNGKLLRELPGHEFSVRALAFSPDGRRLATGGGDGKVVVWDAGSGARLQTLATSISYGVRALSFSSDGTRIASGHENGLIAVWNALTGERVGSFPESKSDPGEVQFSPDGALVTTSTGKIWDAASGALRHDFKKPLYGKVVFSPDGKHAMAGAREKVVLWDVASGKELRRFDYPATSSPLAFSRDGALAAAGGWGKDIDLWDIASGRLVQRFSGASSLTRSIALSPDRTRLAAGDDDLNLTIWNTRTGAVIRRQKEPENVDQLQFSADGSRIIGRSYRLECHWRDKVGPYCTGSRRTAIHSIKLWNSDSGALLGTFSGAPSALAPEGRLLATRGSRVKDDTWSVALWQTADAAPARTLGLANYVTALAFSPDGRRLIAGGDDGALTLFEVATGKLVHNSAGHRGSVASTALSPDGARLVSTGDDKVTKVWKADTGELLATLIEDGEWIAFTPEGFYAASPAGGRLLSLVKGLRVLDPQQAHAILHRPELVREKLAGDPRGTVRAAAADLRFP